MRCSAQRRPATHAGSGHCDALRCSPTFADAELRLSMQPRKPHVRPPLAKRICRSRLPPGMAHLAALPTCETRSWCCCWCCCVSMAQGAPRAFTPHPPLVGGGGIRAPELQRVEALHHELVGARVVAHEIGCALEANGVGRRPACAHACLLLLRCAVPAARRLLRSGCAAAVPRQTLLCRQLP